MIIPKKKFGQNFLKDESILNKIIESMPKSDNLIVEIGPGLGDLTKKLIERKKRVVAFEVDNDLCKYLKKNFSKEIESKNLTLICSDVLEKWEERLADERYDLVANLPYYIATKIILKALKDPNCETLTVMVQKEVALKFCSKEKDKNFASLSILANSICKTKILFDVDRESFYPPPKVTSSVLQMVKFKNYVKDLNEKEGVFDSYLEYEKFESFLKKAFFSPRKTLIKNLSKHYDKKKLEKFLKEQDLPLNIRPHELPLYLYHLLFKNI